MWDGIEVKMIGDKRPTNHKIVKPPPIVVSSVDKIAHLKVNWLSGILKQFESKQEREKALQIVDDLEKTGTISTLGLLDLIHQEPTNEFEERMQGVYKFLFTGACKRHWLQRKTEAFNFKFVIFLLS